MPETAILLQKSIGGIKGQEGHRGGQKGTREGKKGAREGKKGAAPFYFGLAGTLLNYVTVWCFWCFCCYFTYSQESEETQIKHSCKKSLFELLYLFGVTCLRHKTSRFKIAGVIGRRRSGRFDRFCTPFNIF